MNNGNQWSRVDEWRKRGDGFQVTVKHWLIDTPPEFLARYDEGPHRWNVYAYIYPNHPLFERVDLKDNFWQDATGEIPLHGGCTFLRPHCDTDGTVFSVQIGCDYSHAYDERFSWYANERHATEVFEDAQLLFSRLKEMMDAAKELSVQSKLAG